MDFSTDEPGTREVRWFVYRGYLEGLGTVVFTVGPSIDWHPAVWTEHPQIEALDLVWAGDHRPSNLVQDRIEKGWTPPRRFVDDRPTWAHLITAKP